MSEFDPNAPAEEGAGLFGLSQDEATAAIHVIPIPFEATTSYGKGTSKGPVAIFEASHQVDLFDVDTGRPYEEGMVMLPADPEILELDACARGAEVDVVNDCGERLNAIVRAAAARSMDAGKIVGVVGGDHATPFGAIVEAASRQPGMGILHIDAHHDLRVAYEGYTWSHASIMHNVLAHAPDVAKLVQVGIRDFCEQERDAAQASGGRIVTFYDAEIARARFEGMTFADVVRPIVHALPERVWVSFDIDGLDPKLCPNTGTPVPGGLDFNEAVYLLREVVASGRKIIGFDLSEVAPGDDEWDANVGARILYKLCGFALASR